MEKRFSPRVLTEKKMGKTTTNGSQKSIRSTKRATNSNKNGGRKYTTKIVDGVKYMTLK